MRRINTKLPPESTQRGIFFGSSLRQNGSQPHSTRREVFYTLTHHFALFEFFSLRTIQLLKKPPLLDLYASPHFCPLRVFQFAYNSVAKGTSLPRFIRYLTFLSSSSFSVCVQFCCGRKLHSSIYTPSHDLVLLEFSGRVQLGTALPRFIRYPTFSSSPDFSVCVQFSC